MLHCSQLIQCIVVGGAALKEVVAEAEEDVEDRDLLSMEKRAKSIVAQPFLLRVSHTARQARVACVEEGV